MGRVNGGLILGAAALLVALGGTATAAKTLMTGADVKNGSLTGKDLKNGSVTSADVRNGSLTGRDLRNGSVGRADLSPALRRALGGATAAVGTSGRDGAPGAPGVPGTRGERGSTGAQGPQGVQGVQGGRGPIGIQGPPGAFDATLIQRIQGPVVSAAAGGEAVSTASCPAATVVLGGGVTAIDVDPEAFRVLTSNPLSSDNWVVRAHNATGATKPASFRSVAICALR